MAVTCQKEVHVELSRMGHLTFWGSRVPNSSREPLGRLFWDFSGFGVVGSVYGRRDPKASLWNFSERSRPQCQVWCRCSGLCASRRKKDFWRGSWHVCKGCPEDVRDIQMSRSKSWLSPPSRGNSSLTITPSEIVSRVVSPREIRGGELSASFFGTNSFDAPKGFWASWQISRVPSFYSLFLFNLLERKSPGENAENFENVWKFRKSAKK